MTDRLLVAPNSGQILGEAGCGTGIQRGGVDELSAEESEREEGRGKCSEQDQQDQQDQQGQLRRKRQEHPKASGMRLISQICPQRPTWKDNYK